MRFRFLIPIAGLAVGLGVTACGDTTTSSAPASGAATSAPSGSGNAVSISNFKFVPATLSVKVGTQVTFTNSDTATHTATSDDGAPAAFDSSNLDPGKSFSFTFAKAGTYSYHCAIHQFMKATITVS